MVYIKTEIKRKKEVKKRVKEYILFLTALLCLDGLFYLEKAIRRLIKKNFSFGIFETFSIFLGFLGIEEGQAELADGIAEGIEAMEGS